MNPYFLTYHAKLTKIYHDVELIDGSKPVKQHPYRMDPVKQQILRVEVQDLLDNDFIESSQSEWCSPKPDGTFRMCTDYRKENSVTKTDTFLIPRIDDCINNIGQAKYVTKFDLLKGFWHI